MSEKSILTKWKCNQCGRWFNQRVVPDSMNKIVCPGCGNKHWLMLTQETVDKIDVKEKKENAENYL